MKYSVKLLGLSVYILFIAILLCTSCKENTLISSKLSPANDTALIKSFTLHCITHTYYDDTVLTNNGNYSGIAMNQAVGNMVDPFFGTMSAATFFQIAPNSPGYDPFADTSVIGIDSAVLVLPYAGFTYGDTTNQNITQTYQVYYMSDTLGYYSNYYPFSNKSIDVLNPLSGPVTVNTYHLMDSFAITGKDHSGLRIRLSDHFITLLKNTLATTYTATDPSSSFISSFGGICVRPADTRVMTASMPYFRLDGADAYSTAGVILYYRARSSGIIDTLTQQYSYNTQICTHFNSIAKSFNDYSLNALIHSYNANDSVIALQNQPGPGIDVKIFGINSLPAGVIINKAELQLTMLPGHNPTSPVIGPDSLGPPWKLYATGISVANGTNGIYPNYAYTRNLNYLVADQYPTTSTTPLSILDGYLHQFIVGGNTLNTFTVDIPRELMQAIAQKSDTIHLHINGTTDYFGAYHLVAGGGNYPDSNYQAKFKVVYSRLNY